MISLKMDKSQEQSHPAPVEESEYGYGTQIHLEAPQVEALGLKDVEPGKVCDITAKGVVKSITITKQDGKNETRVYIQLTHMETRPASEQSETANKLYGGPIDQGDGGSGMFG